MDNSQARLSDRSRRKTVYIIPLPNSPARLVRGSHMLRKYLYQPQRSETHLVHTNNFKAKILGSLPAVLLYCQYVGPSAEVKSLMSMHKVYPSPENDLNYAAKNTSGRHLLTQTTDVSVTVLGTQIRFPYRKSGRIR